VSPRAATVVRLEGALTLAHGSKSPGLDFVSPVVRRAVLAHGSLWSLLPTYWLRLFGDDYKGTQNSPIAGGRPYEGTHPLPSRRNRPLGRTPGPTVLSVPEALAGTGRRHAVDREMLSHQAVLWQSAGLVNVPLSTHRSTCSAAAHAGARGWSRRGSPYISAQLWTTMWIPAVSVTTRVRIANNRLAVGSFASWRVTLCDDSGCDVD